MKLDNIYTAGFFDGEGCITMQYRESIPHLLHVNISNVYLPVLEAIKYTYGGNISVKKVKQNRLRQYFWQATSEVACKFLREIYPYLLVKQEQAKIALRFQETVNRTRVTLTPEIIALRQVLAAELSRLKKAEFEPPAPMDAGPLFEELSKV